MPREVARTWKRAESDATALASTLPSEPPSETVLAAVLARIDEYWMQEATRWIASGMEGWEASQQHAYLRSAFMDRLPWAAALHRLGNQRFYAEEIPRVRKALLGAADKALAERMVGDLQRLEADAVAFTRVPLAEQVRAILVEDETPSRQADGIEQPVHKRRRPRRLPFSEEAYFAACRALPVRDRTWQNVLGQLTKIHGEAAPSERTLRAWIRQDGLPKPQDVPPAP